MLEIEENRETEGIMSAGQQGALAYTFYPNVTPEGSKML